MTPARFSSTAFVPPGGSWFFQIGEDRVSTSVYGIAVSRVADLLAKHGVKADPAQALADFMCPRMPAWFCTGSTPHSPVITVKEACEAARPYFSRRLLPVDLVTKRMEACQACPRHRRDFCLHCNGLDEWISDGFRGRRPALPADAASGCCTCAGTMEAVIASVEYEDGEPAWKDAPDTCWRKRR